MIPDTHAGIPTEVDVLIRVPGGERELTIGIECRDHKRKADKAWIEQIYGKFAVLPIDRRVAVSRRGFSKTALVRARLHNIETLSLDHANKLDWAAKLLNIQSIDFTNIESELSGTLTILAANVVGDPPQWGPASSIVLSGNRDTSTSLQDFVTALIAKDDIRRRLDAAEPNATTSNLKVSVRFGSTVTALDATNTRFPIEGVAFGVQLRRTSGKVQLTHASYSKAAVATGEGSLGGAPIQVSITQRAGEPAKGHLALKQDGRDVVVELPGLEDLTV